MIVPSSGALLLDLVFVLKSGVIYSENLENVNIYHLWILEDGGLEDGFKNNLNKKCPKTTTEVVEIRM